MRHPMRHFLIFVLTISFNVSYGQDFAYPSIESQGQSIADFVPIGWTILDSATGDLNTDGLKDAIIILQYKDSVRLVNNNEDTVLTTTKNFINNIQKHV